MIFTVKDFCNQVNTNLNSMIAQIARINRNVTATEIKAMMHSYPEVSKLLQAVISKNPNFADAHIALEYQLPAASAWCDVVLLGKNNKNENQVIILELKDWQPNNDKPGPDEGLINHKGVDMEHPSDQVKGYVDYCKNFHSAVVPNVGGPANAHVEGYVFFTRKINLAPYQAIPNLNLVNTHPVYNTDKNSFDALRDKIASTIDSGDQKFANAFMNGHYQQNRSIVAQVAQNLKRVGSVRQFVLLDKQRLGFNKVMSKLKQRVNENLRNGISKDNNNISLKKGLQKEVIIVKGGPGSGKSAVAINLWIEAVLENQSNWNQDNIVFVTTSASQKDNWKLLFQQVAAGADNIVLEANKFNPGIRGGNTVDQKVKNHFQDPKYGGKYIKKRTPKGVILEYGYFEDYLQYMEINGLNDPNYGDNRYFLSIVDEAHALIDPSIPNYKTNKSSGWYVLAGPQAYHIIKMSQISVFFIDPRQSYRDNETTTIKAIIDYANILNAHITGIDISGAQFRCGSSVEYTDWVNAIFTKGFNGWHHDWRRKFDLKIFDSVFAMEQNVRTHLGQNNNSGRILSSYTKDWVSARKIDVDHNPLPPHKNVPHDFEIRENNKLWERYWNYGDDYTVYVQGSKGAMAKDPLCEVGCPFVVRGFDWDHVGLLWLEDLVWRNGQWMLDLDHIKETAINSTLAAVRDEWNNAHEKSNKMIGLIDPFDVRTPKALDLFKTIANAYRVLLTRGIKSISIYIKDKETRDHIQQSVNSLLKDGEAFIYDKDFWNGIELDEVPKEEIEESFPEIPEEDIEKIREEHKMLIDKYKNRVAGDFGIFIEKCKKSKELKKD